MDVPRCATLLDLGFRTFNSPESSESASVVHALPHLWAGVLEQKCFLMVSVSFPSYLFNDQVKYSQPKGVFFKYDFLLILTHQ